MVYKSPNLFANINYKTSFIPWNSSKLLTLIEP